MRHAAAWAIRWAWVLFGVWAIGYAARGQRDRPELAADLAAGAAIVGGALAVAWAEHELDP